MTNTTDTSVTPQMAAAAVWQTFNENERHGVRFGMFPAEKMHEADLNFPHITSHELVVALMTLAAAQPAAVVATRPRTGRLRVGYVPRDFVVTVTETTVKTFTKIISAPSPRAARDAVNASLSNMPDEMPLRDEQWAVSAIAVDRSVTTIDRWVEP